MRVTILGSGTSAGVPMIGCDCPVCRSDDPRDKRTRPSIVVQYGNTTVLVDTTPELRMQALANRLMRIDAVVFTHAHADHIFGLDDVRRYNSILGAPLPVYGDGPTLAALRRIYPYAFLEQTDRRIFRPELTPEEITGPFAVGEKTWQPIALPHGSVDVLGFRIDNFAYCTDCRAVPPEARAKLRGLDALIIDALRPREHPTHLSFAQALEVIRDLAPRQAWFTHLAHDVPHSQERRLLPENVHFAYDTLTIDVADPPVHGQASP